MLLSRTKVIRKTRDFTSRRKAVLWTHLNVGGDQVAGHS